MPRCPKDNRPMKQDGEEYVCGCTYREPVIPGDFTVGVATTRVPGEPKKQPVEPRKAKIYVKKKSKPKSRAKSTPRQAKTSRKKKRVR